MSKGKKAVISSVHRKNFIKFLEILANRRNGWTVFEDFLAMAAISISNNSDPYHIATSEEVKAEREKRYLDIASKYNRVEQEFIASMFAELVMELDSGFSKEPYHLVDVLGELFQESNFNNQHQGQFFTPQNVCDLVGSIGVGSNETIQQEIDRCGYFTIREPCCGSGALIYGMINAMLENGLNPNKNVLVFAGDIDERCVLMTYIQCSLYGIPAIVQQQDAMTDEILSPAWFTPIYVIFNWRWNSSRGEYR